MQQYEERLTRVNRHMDESNATYLKTQEELKSVRTKQDEDMRKRDRFISAMLDCSS